MNISKAIGMLLLAMLLPGIVTYSVVRLKDHQANEYTILPPDKAPKEEAKITHGTPSSDQPTDYAAAQPGAAAGNPGMMSPGSGAMGGQVRSSQGGYGTGQTSSSSPMRTGAPSSGAMQGQQTRGNGTGRPMTGTFALMRTFRGIGRLEEGGESPLSPAQARAILAVMNPIRKQKSLTPEQATQAAAKLQAILTPLQRDAIAQAGPGRGGREGGPREGGPGGSGGFRQGGPDGERGGDRPSGFGGPGGPGANGAGGPGGGERRMPEGMENMNPFNPDSDNPMAERMAERWKPIFEALEAKAKQ